MKVWLDDLDPEDELAGRTPCPPGAAALYCARTDRENGFQRFPLTHQRQSWPSRTPDRVVVAVGRDLHAALEREHDLVEGMPVTAELRIGRVVPTIVDIAKEAMLIVLERRDLSTMMRVATRSVSSSVAARAVAHSF